MAAYDEPDPRGPRGSSGKATASLVLGVSSFCASFLTGGPAVVLGLLSLRDINRSEGRLTGGGQALAGIITGILGSLLSGMFIGFFCIFPGMMAWYTFSMLTDMVKIELNANPVIQERIGNIDSISLNFMETGELQDKKPGPGSADPLMCYEVKGPKGEGQVRARMSEKGGRMRLKDGTLIMKDGQRFELRPVAEPPEK